MKKEFQKRILSSIILIPVAIFFIIKGSFLFNFFLLISLLVCIQEWHKMRNKKEFYVIGLFFLIISFYSIYALRNNFEGDYVWLLFITTICVATDIGGYVFGKLFKGPKLTKFSPNKTYSGMIGGYFLSLISANFFLQNLIVDINKDISTKIFIFVLLVSSISQLGDIIISYFKRLSKIKDTGKIIPGHGVLLDRFDGYFLILPLYNIYLLFFF